MTPQRPALRYYVGPVRATPDSGNLPDCIPAAAPLPWTVRAVLLCLLALGAARLGHAQRESWSTTNRVLAGTSLVLIAADWLQTIDIARQGHRERNPLLGPHPSVGRVNLLVPLGAVAVIGGAHCVRSAKGRTWLLGVFTGLAALNVFYNHAMGVRFSTRF